MADQTPNLDNIRGQLEEEHRLATDMANQAMQHAIKCGEYLREVKTQLPHGQFQEWIAEHCSFSVRTAQGYMRLASKAQRVSHLSIREGLESLAEPRLVALERCFWKITDDFPLPEGYVYGVRLDYRLVIIIEHSAHEPETFDCWCLIEDTNYQTRATTVPRVATLALLDFSKEFFRFGEREYAFQVGVNIDGDGLYRIFMELCKSDLQVFTEWMLKGRMVPDADWG